MDASQALLETACSAAEDQEIETLGIKADISSPVHLVLASDASESPKLLLVSGNTLGSFDPLDQIRHIAQCMHPGDRLIIDCELYDEQRARADQESGHAEIRVLAAGEHRDDAGRRRGEHREQARRTARGAVPDGAALPGGSRYSRHGIRARRSSWNEVNVCP